MAWTLQPSYGASDGDLALAAGPSLWIDEQLESTDRLHPFTEVRFREAGSHHIGLGLALQASSWNLELPSSTEKGANASPTGNVELNFSKKL